MHEIQIEFYLHICTKSYVKKLGGANFKVQILSKSFLFYTFT